MLVLCKFCLNSCKKQGKVDCDIYKTETPEDWQKELKTLLDGSNPQRSNELRKKLDYFYYGIK